MHFNARSDHDSCLRTRALCGLGACAIEDAGGTMTSLEDIDALKTRLARALSERDAWRAAGLQEKYLEAIRWSRRWSCNSKSAFDNRERARANVTAAKRWQ